MIISKSIRRTCILGFEIVVCIIIGVIASNALAAQATLAWDPNTESDLAGYRVHYGTASGSYTVHTDVHNVTSYTVTGLTAGQTYYFAATAYDASGNESGYSNPVSYAVPGVNGAPTTPATPTCASSALVNTAIAFSTSATDPNGDSLQYQYDWGGGVLSGWGAASQSHSWAAAGQYAVKAQARDSLGLASAWSGAKTVTISANPQNQAPAANAGSDQTVNAATAVSLSGTGTDPENGTLTYQWRQTEGTSVTLSNPTSARASFTAPNIATGTATLTFELRVTDAAGLSAVDTLAVVVQSPDIDGDRVPNSQDAFPANPAEWKDSNSNGIGDNAEAAAAAAGYSIGFFRPSTGEWFLDLNGNGIWDGPNIDRYYANFGKGLTGAIPVVGDWDGSGSFKVGVYWNGSWYLDLNGNGVWDGPKIDRYYADFGKGLAGAIPVVGDWGGNGNSKVGIYWNGSWYLDLNGNGKWDGNGADGFYKFGKNGDLPVAGDWDNDGVAEIGFFRPSTGQWYLDLSGNDKWDGSGVDGLYKFGENGARPIVGQW